MGNRLVRRARKRGDRDRRQAEHDRPKHRFHHDIQKEWVSGIDTRYHHCHAENGAEGRAMASVRRVHGQLPLVRSLPSDSEEGAHINGGSSPWPQRLEHRQDQQQGTREILVKRWNPTGRNKGPKLYQLRGRKIGRSGDTIDQESMRRGHAKKAAKLRQETGVLVDRRNSRSQDAVPETKRILLEKTRK